MNIYININIHININIDSWNITWTALSEHNRPIRVSPRPLTTTLKYLSSRARRHSTAMPRPLHLEDASRP